MDMFHIKLLKEALEKEMTQLVRDFEVTTGCHISFINQNVIQCVGAKQQTQNIELVVVVQ